MPIVVYRLVGRWPQRNTREFLTWMSRRLLTKEEFVLIVYYFTGFERILF